MLRLNQAVDKEFNPAKLQENLVYYLDPTFDLKAVPAMLYSLIVEKMTYFEYSVFDQCSSFSNKMCEIMPRKVKNTVYVEDIYINKEIKLFTKNDIMATLKSFKQVTEKARFITKELRTNLHRQSPFDDVHKHGIRADHVEVFGSLHRKHERVKQLLLVTKAKSFKGRINFETSELSELHRLQEICSTNPSDLNPEMLLKFKAEYIWISSFEFSSAIVEGLLQQWHRGERKIKKIHLMSPEVSICLLCKKFCSVFIPLSNGAQVLLCRSEDHNDCISIEKQVDQSVIIKHNSVCSKIYNE